MKNKAFTLMEVLVAMAVFLLAMVFISAMFPAAAVLQKQTIDEVNTQVLADNMKAMILARKIPQSELVGELNTSFPNFDDDGLVYPMPFLPDVPPDIDYSPDNLGGWSLRDRAQPLHTSVELAKLYWVPMVRDANKIAGKHRWEVFVFVLRGGERDGYPRFGIPSDWANPDDKVVQVLGDGTMIDKYVVPGVRRQSVTIGMVNVNGTQVPKRFEFDNKPWQLRAGDTLLDQYGTIHPVIKADNLGVEVAAMPSQPSPWPNAPVDIWFSPPPGQDRASPLTEIVILTDAVDPRK